MRFAGRTRTHAHTPLQPCRLALCAPPMFAVAGSRGLPPPSHHSARHAAPRYHVQERSSLPLSKCTIEKVLVNSKKGKREIALRVSRRGEVAASLSLYVSLLPLLRAFSAAFLPFSLCVCVCIVMWSTKYVPHTHTHATSLSLCPPGVPMFHFLRT